MTDLAAPLSAVPRRAIAVPAREARLAAAGAGLIALRLVEERQWLALALVAVLSFAYGVLRPSLRAAVAFAAGALSLVGAGIAIADARWNGFAGHQLPAFALVAGGTALLVAAVLALRSKPRVSGARRAVRWGLTFIATILVGYYAVVPIGAALWLTGKPRVAVRTFVVPHENVALRTADGIRLAAWYVPSRNGAAIVLVHGGGGDRDGLKLHATMLARHGYGVLLYDERGRGDSGGRSNGFGWDWSADVRASVDFLERRGIRHVGVLGLSTGAEVAITAAAEDARVAAVVADGAEARTLDDFAHLHGADRITSLPYWAVATAAVRVIRHTEPPPPLDEVVPRIAPRPLLLVQSNDAAEKSIAPVWARVDGRPGVLWHVDAPHTKGLAFHPRTYEERVVGLFDRTLLSPHRS
ncbi:MAG: alpha/beta hydrolase [Gaiellaceae bacterium]